MKFVNRLSIFFELVDTLISHMLAVFPVSKNTRSLSTTRRYYTNVILVNHFPRDRFSIRFGYIEKCPKRLCVEFLLIRNTIRQIISIFIILTIVSN